MFKNCITGAILGAIVGFIAFLVVGLALWIVVGLITGDSQTGEDVGEWAALFVPAGIVIGIMVPISEKISKKREYRQREERKEKARRQREEREEKARRQHHREEQQRCRNQMINLGEQSLVLFESMPKLLHSVEGYLDQAEAEFADGAFAPFWDCIENAATRLGLFDQGIRQIKDNSGRYSDLTRKYEEVPPRFPLAHESIPKLAVASTSAERMQAIVRKAQRDFQFATIYEQRKTNQILVAGFTNLAQALKDMTWQLGASINDLAQSVEGVASTLDESLRATNSRLGDIAETVSRHADQALEATAQASRREQEVLHMLDNIQHRRRPFP